MEKRCYNTAESLDYLGIKRRSFEAHILPSLHGKGVRIGNCIVFEKIDLDHAWDSYKVSIGSEGLRSRSKGEIWGAEKKSEFFRPVRAGSLSTEDIRGSAFDAAASQILQRRKNG